MSKLCDLAIQIGAELIGDSNVEILGLNEIECAMPSEITFLENVRYQRFLNTTHAGAVILERKLLPQHMDGKSFLIHPCPSKAFQQLIEYFTPIIPSAFEGIHPTAVIHPSVRLGEHVTIGPHVVIDQQCHIGSFVCIKAGVVIGPNVHIADKCILHANVVVEASSKIGANVVIQPGAVIGSCGFGYYTDKQGHHFAYQHLGNVIIEDDVEIGANTTIDRARFKSTIIGKGTKIDNLVQIAHQVEIGEFNLVVAQVGIAGSTKTGKNVVIGGQVGIAGHLTLADHVVLTARAAVSKSLDKADVYYGAPALPSKEFKSQFIALRKIKHIVDKFQKLEKRFAHLLDEEDENEEDEIEEPNEKALMN